MALGGGIFLVQNKVLPGSYINFIAAAKATATLSDRGTAAIALDMDWGADGEVIMVENADFQKESLKIFGYDYTSDKLKGLRDLFLNAKTAYIYRLNSGVKASNAYAEAKYSGTRGNDLKIVIQKNVDDEDKLDVMTYLDTALVDTQTVPSATELVSNDYVNFKAGATLEETSGISLASGTNGEVSGSSHQAFLDKIESYSFNTLGCTSAEETIKALYVAFTKRMRDEVGAKFQTVVHNYPADYEGVINVKNEVADEGAIKNELVYFVTGIEAACAVNKSNTNKTYNGEYDIKADYKQSELEKALLAGELVFHKVGDTIKILDDVNSLVSVTSEKGEDFKLNQVIRVLDQVGNDVANTFNTKYLGIVQNTAAGRIAFWNDLITYCKELQKLSAIENFNSEDIVVEAGNDKKSVAVTMNITPACAMAKLYMTVIVN